MTSQHWQPYREPFRTTLLRTGTIALVVGGILAERWGGLSRWPTTTLLVLWPSLGGHFLELWFLNWLRPRLPSARLVQLFARLLTWFLGGAILALAMSLTAIALKFPPAQWFAHEPISRPAWWLGGLAFIAIELIAHLFLQLRRCPSFYNGRG